MNSRLRWRSSTSGVNHAGEQIDAGQQADCVRGACIRDSRAKVACTPGSGGRSGAVVGDAPGCPASRRKR